MENNTLVSGLFYNEPRPGAPEFVMGGISFRKEEFIKWLSEQEDTKGYVNVDILMSKAGKPYAKLNTFKPKATADTAKDVFSAEQAF